MLLARIIRAEHLDMAAVRKLEDPEPVLGQNQSQAEDLLVEAASASARSVRVPHQPNPVTFMTVSLACIRYASRGRSGSQPMSMPRTMTRR